LISFTIFFIFYFDIHTQHASKKTHIYITSHHITPHSFIHLIVQKSTEHDTKWKTNKIGRRKKIKTSKMLFPFIVVAVVAVFAVVVVVVAFCA